MFGTTIGTLNLYQVVAGSKDTLIWTLSKNQGNNWFTGQVPVGNAAGFKVSTLTGVIVHMAYQPI